MEKRTLIPQYHEIIVNNGSLEGAVDLFSYGPESDQAFHPLGTLYIVGHRDTDSSNMGYMVSLIAALARREYYAQPGTAPRDAFARMLKRVNEVVDEFFRSASVDLSVGIFAIAGSSLLVSKLDKFKILLARQGETIDILNNVMLFRKELVQKRRFSSIISGSVQTGDRILAYYPSKPVTTRERYLKSYLTKLPYPELAAKLDELGRQHPAFAASLVCVDMVQSAEPAAIPDIQPQELAPKAEPARPVPTESAPHPISAWKPRQSSPIAATDPSPEHQPEPEEVPRIISTEFALGTRRSPFSKWSSRVPFVRLDTRGKAVFLATAVAVIVVGILIAQSVFFIGPQEQKLRQTVQGVKDDLQLAQSKVTTAPGEARQILMRALSTLGESDLKGNKDARNLTASLVQTMDTLDNAQAGTLSLAVQLDPAMDPVALAVWSSPSHSFWAVTRGADDVLTAGQVNGGILTNSAALGAVQASEIVPFESGVLVVDATNRKVIRIVNGTAKSFSISTQDTLLSASSYQGNLYLLTDHAILKVSDLNTDKPLTKQWLTSVNDFAAGAAQVYVDGSVWTLGPDGMLTQYYKGKKKGAVQTPLEPSGNWRLVAGPQDSQLAVANSDTKRVYIIDTTSGTLVRTLKVDTAQTILQMSAGPDGSFLFITKDNKLWQVK